jgi:hypothetical protein
MLESLSRDSIRAIHAYLSLDIGFSLFFKMKTFFLCVIFLLSIMVVIFLVRHIGLMKFITQDFFGITDFQPDIIKADHGNSTKDEVTKLLFTSNVTKKHGNETSLRVPKSKSAPTTWKHRSDVVIVTKIHGHIFLRELRQSLCLLNAAYNHRTKHDIIVFHTIEMSQSLKQEVKDIVAPAKLTFVLDEKTLQAQINELSPEQQRILVDRCLDVNSTEDIVWNTRCMDGVHKMPIAYCWMSEFRSKHIWTHKALISYKYMIWWDSDAFATKAWKKDPIDYMVQHNSVLLMANYGQGSTAGSLGVQNKVLQAYGKSLCSASLLPGGKLNATFGDATSCMQTSIQQVHGFFHITDLDFYRLPQNLRWFDIMIGNEKFSRRWDDQLAVIVPAIMLAHDRVVDMDRAGLTLGVFHNSMMMGKKRFGVGSYIQFWKSKGKKEFPEAFQNCSSYIKRHT